MSTPRVPAQHSATEPKNWWVCKVSFPPSAGLSSTTNTLIPSLPSSMAAQSPAGPPPSTNTWVWYSPGRPGTTAASSAGRAGCPSQLATAIPSWT